MKKLLIAGVAAAAFYGAPALAADMAVKAPPSPPAPAWSWAGFYIGGNVGGGWGSDDWTFAGNVPSTPGPGLSPIPAGANEQSHDVSGWLAGGQIGYNWQSGPWVFGPEIMWDWANLKGQHITPPSLFSDLLQSKVDSVGLLTGRVGYAWNNILLYGKGGVAWADDWYGRGEGVAGLGPPAGVIFAVSSEWRTGWTAGIGFEYGFAPNWSAAVEWDYAGFGTKQEFFSLLPIAVAAGFRPFNENIGENINLVTVRLNYRFGLATPVKY